MFQVRPDALSFVALVLGHDFALGEKPQSGKPVTLIFNNGKHAYMAQKHN